MAKKKVTPIRPEHMPKQKREQIPDLIIETVNKLIAEKWNTDTREAIVYQDDILKAIGKKLDHDEIFDKHWLDIEDIYCAQGWKVVYDSPAYCESYPAYFVFSIKK